MSLSVQGSGCEKLAEVNQTCKNPPLNSLKPLSKEIILSETVKRTENKFYCFVNTVEPTEVVLSFVINKLLSSNL